MNLLKISLVICGLLIISGCQNDEAIKQDIKDETIRTEFNESNSDKNYKEDNSYNFELLNFLPNNGEMTDENNLTVHYLINNEWNYSITFNTLSEAEKMPQIGYYLIGHSNLDGESYETYVNYQVVKDCLLINSFDVLMNKDVYSPISVNERWLLDLSKSKEINGETDVTFGIRLDTELIGEGLSSKITEVNLNAETKEVESYTFEYRFEDGRLKEYGYSDGIYQETLTIEKGIGLKTLKFNVPTHEEQPEWIKNNNFLVEVEYIGIE